MNISNKSLVASFFGTRCRNR